MSDVLSIEKNSNGLPEAKIMDQKWLNDSLQKLNWSVAANSNLGDIFTKKIQYLNGQWWKNINDPVRELNYALEEAKKGNINHLTASLWLETITQTQKNNEDTEKKRETAEKLRRDMAAEEVASEQARKKAAEAAKLAQQQAAKDAEASNRSTAFLNGVKNIILGTTGWPVIRDAPKK